MAAPSKILIDAYSALSHKELVGDGTTHTTVNYAPTWVPQSERRRLAAYVVRAALWQNCGRLVLPNSVDDDERKGYREYGDVKLLVDRLVAAILGTDGSIVVDGADDDLLDGPELPDMPEEPTGDDAADVLVQRIYQGKLAAWTAAATAEVDAWEAAIAEQPAAQRAQAELRAWAERVQLDARLNEAEQKAVALGDAVYVLWPRDGDWPTVQVYDPDCYFPELPDNGDALAYPNVVHLAWEYETVEAGTTTRWVRRLTWELVDLTSQRLVDDGNGGAVWLGPDGPLEPGQALTLPDTERFTDGQIRRQLPWHDAGDEPSTVTCVFSDGSWDLSKVDAGKVDALDDDTADWVVRRADMGIDFLPVVHLPGTAEGAAHYGRSVIDPLCQILDDLATNDGDVASASSYLGNPTVVSTGAQAPDEGVMAPGLWIGMPNNGNVTVLDLAPALDKLMASGDRLADRLWVNAGLPRELVGGGDADTSSGIHLALKLAPANQLVGTLRDGRSPKLDLLLKFSVRMAQVAGALEPGPTPPAHYRFGAFLPTDRKAVIDMVVAAVAAHAMSTTTAVQLMVEAGVEVDDVMAEVARIRYENPTAAMALADALAGGNGDPQVREWLGLQPADGVAPVITLPPAPAE